MFSCGFDNLRYLPYRVHSGQKRQPVKYIQYCHIQVYLAEYYNQLYPLEIECNVLRNKRFSLLKEEFFSRNAKPLYD